MPFSPLKVWRDSSTGAAVMGEMKRRTVKARDRIVENMTTMW